MIGTILSLAAAFFGFLGKALGLVSTRQTIVQGQKDQALTDTQAGDANALVAKKVKDQVAGESDDQLAADLDKWVRGAGPPKPGPGP